MVMYSWLVVYDSLCWAVDISSDLSLIVQRSDLTWLCVLALRRVIPPPKEKAGDRAVAA